MSFEMHISEIPSLISFFFLFLAGVCNASMDVLTHYHSNSIFKKMQNKYGYFWANPVTESWKNKYINRNPLEGRVHWGLFGIKIIKPVALTDAWHLFKSLMLISIAIVVVLFSEFFESSSLVWGLFINIILVRAVFGFGFVLFYNKFLIKSK